MTILGAADPMNWCENPEPVDDEPFVTDPECATCGHKMSCHDNTDECSCDDGEGED